MNKEFSNSLSSRTFSNAAHSAQRSHSTSFHKFPTVHQTSITETATIYVGDLNPMTTESTLFSFFSVKHNPISVRIVRNSSTNVSYGYAYVNFINREDAEKAVKNNNFKLIDGCTVRMMLKSEQHAPNPKANIFVKNLDPKVSTRALYECLSIFGEIDSIKIPEVEKEGGKMRLNYGFVQFRTEKGAKSALNYMKDLQIGSSVVSASIFVPRAEREKEQLKEEKSFIIKYVPVGMTEEELKKGLCVDVVKKSQKEGEVEKEEKTEEGLEKLSISSEGKEDDILEVKSFYLKAAKKFSKTTVCFVQLLNKEDNIPLKERVDRFNANLLIKNGGWEREKINKDNEEGDKEKEDKEGEEGEEGEEKNNENLEREKQIPKLELERIKSKVELINEKRTKQHKIWLETKFRNIYIKNIPKHFTEKDFLALCSDFGEVSSIFLAKEKDSSSALFYNKGFGFCCFTKEESAANAIKELDGKFLEQRDLQACYAMNKKNRMNELKDKRITEGDFGGQYKMLGSVLPPSEPYYRQYMFQNRNAVFEKNGNGFKFRGNGKSYSNRYNNYGGPNANGNGGGNMGGYRGAGRKNFNRNFNGNGMNRDGGDNREINYNSVDSENSRKKSEGDKGNILGGFREGDVGERQRSMDLRNRKEQRERIFEEKVSELMPNAEEKEVKLVCEIIYKMNNDEGIEYLLKNNQRLRETAGEVIKSVEKKDAN